MKKGQKPTPSSKQKTNYHDFKKKLTIESTTNYKLIISENTKHIDIAGEGRALVSHRGTYLMLSEGLMSSITKSYGTYLLTVTVALVKLQDTHAQRDLNSGRITTTLTGGCLCTGSYNYLQSSSFNQPFNNR